MQRLTIILLVLSSIVTAEVYKSVGPDGRPVFTDRPIQNAIKLELPVGAEPEQTKPIGEPDSYVEHGYLGPYTAFEIADPDDDTTLRNDDREIQVSLLLSPPLIEGHRLRVDVDGVSAEGDLGKGTQVRLNGLALGSHRIQAMVEDDSGAVVAATPLINVHIRPALP
ncbi:MAG: DUF4124 domain-containing protein [Thiohalocapsa sp.]